MTDNVVDLNKYREKITSAEGDNTILQEVVNDACREIIENAVWIAKDLGININDVEFIANLSGAYHYYSQALAIGFGLKDPSNSKQQVISEDVKEWIDHMIEHDEGTDE